MRLLKKQAVSNGGEESSYNIGLYEFIAKKGYIVVFAPYPTTGVTIDSRYNTLWQSFKKAVTDYPSVIDTRKVGFMGHSFGGGASFSLAYRAFTTEGWGQDSRFIFSMAQWYSCQISPDELQSFPANTKLISQVYDDDVTTGCWMLHHRRCHTKQFFKRYVEMGIVFKAYFQVYVRSAKLLFF